MNDYTDTKKLSKYCSMEWCELYKLTEKYRYMLAGLAIFIVIFLVSSCACPDQPRQYKAVKHEAMVWRMDGLEEK